LIPDINIGIVTLFVFIILLGVISTLVAYIGLKRNESKLENLSQPYKERYMVIQESVYLASISKTMKKEILEMVLEIFEHANLNERDVNEVIGDTDTFINNFISKKQRHLTPMFWLTYGSTFFLGYIIFMKLYKVIRLGTLSYDAFLTESLDVGIVISYALISYVFMPWLLMTMRKVNRNRDSVFSSLKLVLPFIVPVFLFGILILTPDGKFRNFLDQPLIIFNHLEGLLLLFIAFLISLMGYKFETRKMTRKNLEN
jgi:DNA-binding ferritin-like protein (Dps family)